MQQLHSVKTWFDAIATGTKTVEGRLFSTVANLAPGDKIVFVCGDDACICTVNHVVRYSCFAEMLDMETLRLVLPGVQNLQQGIQVFRQWYSKSLESKHGVGAVRFTKTS